MSDDTGRPNPDGQKNEEYVGVGKETNFYSWRYPRIYLWKETIGALKEAGVPSSVADVTEYCNEAIQYAIKAGQAATPNVADVMAALSALNSRCRELAALQLELLSVAQDASLLVEQLTLAGPILEEIYRAQAKAREVNLEKV